MLMSPPRVATWQMMGDLTSSVATAQIQVALAAAIPCTRHSLPLSLHLPARPPPTSSPLVPAPAPAPAQALPLQVPFILGAMRIICTRTAVLTFNCTPQALSLPPLHCQARKGSYPQEAFLYTILLIASPPHPSSKICFPQCIMWVAQLSTASACVHTAAELCVLIGALILGAFASSWTPPPPEKGSIDGTPKILPRLTPRPWR